MGVLKKASRARLELAFFCCDLLPLPTMLTAYCYKTLNGEASAVSLCGAWRCGMRERHSRRRNVDCQRVTKDVARVAINVFI